MKTITDAKSLDRDWLKTYYYLRFAVSAIWVALAFTVAKAMPPLAAMMLVAYPAWDALANYLDASRSGGLMRNKSQMLNFVVSVATAMAVAATLRSEEHTSELQSLMRTSYDVFCLKKKKKHNPKLKNRLH